MKSYCNEYTLDYTVGKTTIRLWLNADHNTSSLPYSPGDPMFVFSRTPEIEEFDAGNLSLEVLMDVLITNLDHVKTIKVNAIQIQLTDKSGVTKYGKSGVTKYGLMKYLVPFAEDKAI